MRPSSLLARRLLAVALTLATALATAIAPGPVQAVDANPQSAVQAFYELRIAQLPNGGLSPGCVARKASS